MNERSMLFQSDAMLFPAIPFSSIGTKILDSTFFTMTWNDISYDHYETVTEPSSSTRS